MDAKQLEEGVFCQLKMGRWDAIIRMSNEHFGHSIPKEIVRARQDIIKDRSLLEDLGAVRNSAKGMLLRNSLPFPIDGISWVPKDKIVEIDKSLAVFRDEYRKRIDKLCQNMEQMKKDFQKQYPSYFDNKNYPTVPMIRKKFYFYWNFFHFVIPSKKTKILSPALYKREQEKFAKMVSEMEEMTINVIGNLLFKRIDKLASQCDSGKINAGTVNSIDRFLKQWDSLWRDHVGEAKMHAIMKDLRQHMGKTSAERLKGNEDFREKLGTQLEKMMDKLQMVPDFTLKRKLDV
jgi:hypothetical protein